MATQTQSQSSAQRETRASKLHAIADELGVAPELVASIAKERKLKVTQKDAIIEAVKAYIAAQEGKDDGKTGDTTPKPEKKKKAGLTLSQRRALLRLLDAMDEGISPDSPFRALPYEHLVEVGYATVADSGDGEQDDSGDPIRVYTLTDEGLERAESINPGYRDWSSGETVVLDADGNPAVVDSETGEPIRQPHGTHRAAKAAEQAAKAKAEAEAKAKADAEAAKQAEKDAKAAEKEAEANAKKEQAKEVTTA
jgi:hypothetical protein